MINKSHSYFERLSEAFYKIDTSKIELFKKKIKKMMGTPRTLFIAGNGGSSAISSHMVCDLSKTILGKHQNEKINRLRAHSLNENIPTITAWANDFGYEYIFSG
jgi:phosphoheptose isomerase